ncbi:MAG: hypothetical protein ACOWWM_17095 [Desulfobacterales bacterium]
MALVGSWYERNGYDPATGRPTKQTFERLRIADIGERLEKDGPYPKWDGPPLRDPNAYPGGWKRC